MIEMKDVFKAAIGGRASDVILTAGSPPVFRINGELVPGQTPPLSVEEVGAIVTGLLRPEQRERLERQRELDFSLCTDGVHRFRGNAFWQRGALAAAFRLIPDRVPSLKDLGLPAVVEEFALAAMGLVLLSGPTGHGKSTSLAAMLNLINERKRVHIVTIEDPIEFVHANRKSVIEQREVGDDTLSFANALRAVLRQAPDVILVGEMRDPESIAAAITAAETGHLVFATVHTNDSVQAIDRLIDVFPSHQQNQVRAQLSMSLLAVISQRLIRKTDGRGRVAAVEVLRNVAAVANLVREGKTHQIYTILETHARDGMCTLDASLKDLYLTGQVSLEEARRRMRNPASLEKL
ncbi:MAG: type IV pilus twitching motility protein PilT [Candidatus Brocadiae bacterium]|nr:type IV pilus twitching motility protein PilT [Candidatus Brocadiia bacterium]